LTEMGPLPVQAPAMVLKSLAWLAAIGVPNRRAAAKPVPAAARAKTSDVVRQTMKKRPPWNLFDGDFRRVLPARPDGGP
jgi:hypothetical protein